MPGAAFAGWLVGLPLPPGPPAIAQRARPGPALLAFTVTRESCHPLASAAAATWCRRTCASCASSTWPKRRGASTCGELPPPPPLLLALRSAARSSAAARAWGGGVPAAAEPVPQSREAGGARARTSHQPGTAARPASRPSHRPPCIPPSRCAPVPPARWDYVTLFGQQCDMESRKYGQECAEKVFEQVRSRPPALQLSTSSCHRCWGAWRPGMVEHAARAGGPASQHADQRLMSTHPPSQTALAADQRRQVVERRGAARLHRAAGRGRGAPHHGGPAGGAEGQQQQRRGRGAARSVLAGWGVWLRKGDSSGGEGEAGGQQEAEALAAVSVAAGWWARRPSASLEVPDRTPFLRLPTWRLEHCAGLHPAHDQDQRRAVPRQDGHRRGAARHLRGVHRRQHAAGLHQGGRRGGRVGAAWGWRGARQRGGRLAAGLHRGAGAAAGSERLTLATQWRGWLAHGRAASRTPRFCPHQQRSKPRVPPAAPHPARPWTTRA